MFHTKVLKSVSSVGVLALTAGFLMAGVAASDVSAAGVVTTISPSTSAVSTAAVTTVSYTTSAALATGNTLRFTRPTAYTGTLSTANLTVNGTAPSAVVNAVSGTNTLSTLTLAAPIVSGATVSIATTAAALTTPAVAGNYSFSVYSPNTGDYGAVLQYVGQANVVQVRAFVPITLSFVIRDATDTANTNLCDMGDVSTASINLCSYRLKVTTNAKNGYTVSATTSGNLTNGSVSMSNAAAGTAGTGGTAITAGTEKYGVVIAQGGVDVGGTITRAGAFDAGATNAVSYVQASPTVIMTSTGPNTPAVSADTTKTSLVEHQLGITNSTAAGLYTQTVTYTVAASF
jgi:hypothetical protein